MLEHGSGLAGRDVAPGAAERFLSKAVAHREAGRLDKARQNLGRILDMAPDHASARYELGLLIARTEGAAAIPHFAAAAKGAQTNPACWLALLGAPLETQRMSDARHRRAVSRLGFGGPVRQGRHRAGRPRRRPRLGLL